MSRTSGFMGFTEADEKALHLGRVLMILLPTANIIFTLSSTFYTIFVAEALGGGDFIEGLGLLGVLVAIEMITQTILDYPSGALGDAIGQRYVIAIGNSLYAVVFFMISFVNTTTPFFYLVIIYMIQGVAQSQISGAWSAWFDNNYKIAMPHDTDRKQYGVFWGRMGMISQIAATAVLIPGSILATVFNRPFVFQLEAVGAVFFAIMVMRYIRDFPEVEALRDERPSMSQYTTLLKEGVSFLWHTPFVKYLCIGSMLTASTITVWGNLILFPLYFSYLITDVAVASYRTIAFIPGVAANERSGVWSQKFEPKKWIPRFRLVQACGFVFYILLAAMMFFFPPVTEAAVMATMYLPFTSIVLIELPIQHILPIVMLFSIFTVTMFFGGFAEILTQRELLDVIPDRNRNSLYSLQPTILLLLATPQIAIFGWIIPIIGFPATLLICAFISLIGVLIIRYALSLEKPVITRETPQVESADETIELDDASEAEQLLDELAEEVEQVPLNPE
ncbi:MAG: MFS transporter [Candidatus Thorarchaeota archaeon]|nr:MFS transporter [Candidatus Thorarchaeota archaeon]